MQKNEKMLWLMRKNTCNLYKLTYSNTRDNYSKIRVLEKVAIRSSTRVLDTRRWNHYLWLHFTLTYFSNVKVIKITSHTHPRKKFKEHSFFLTYVTSGLCLASVKPAFFYSIEVLIKNPSTKLFLKFSVCKISEF